jgi:hypothetical protein
MTREEKIQEMDNRDLAVGYTNLVYAANVCDNEDLLYFAHLKFELRLELERRGMSKTIECAEDLGEVQARDHIDARDKPIGGL